MSTPIDFLIAGAGPVGCVVARALADEGHHVVVTEKRNHLAGNCFDQKDSHGVLVHRYGPHYFRTNSDSLMKYLERFSQFHDSDYIVKSSVRETLLPIPINLTTLENYFGVTLSESTAPDFLKSLQVAFKNPPANSEEFVLSRVGPKMFADFYEGYTLKQWARPARELDASVCGRIPVRMNRYDRYVDHKYQRTPSHGFTELFKSMLTHSKIELRLNTDFFEVRKSLNPKHGTLYTGPIDEYFGNCFGPLAWRSLRFDFKHYQQEQFQPCVQINYPAKEIPFTRTVEIKHITRQKHAGTTVCYEYPTGEGEPYYPLPMPETKALYKKYEALATEESKKNPVYFSGRLAKYVYINTDEAIEMALKTAEEILIEIRKKKNMSTLDLAVVMPVFNEEASVAKVFYEWLPELDRLKVNYQLIAIDDGSKDRTLEILKTLQNASPGKVIVHSHTNRGHGLSCLVGYELAIKNGAQWILQIDSDGQCDAKYLPQFWSNKSDNQPVLFGYRHQRDDGFERFLISRVVSLVCFFGLRRFCQRCKCALSINES